MNSQLPTRKPRLFTVALLFAILAGAIQVALMVGLTRSFNSVDTSSQRIYEIAMPMVFDAMRQLRVLERLKDGGRAILYVESAAERKQFRQNLESIATDGVLQGASTTREAVSNAFKVIDANLADLAARGNQARPDALQRWAPIENVLNDIAEGVVAESSTAYADDLDNILDAVAITRERGKILTASLVIACLAVFALFVWLVVMPISRLAGAMDKAREGEPMPPGNERLLEMAKLDDAAHALADAHNELNIVRRELEVQANTDTLTGLANRRRFATVGDAELKRSLRYQRSLSLIAIDIDFFKSINDRFGHDGGDAVLAALGSRLLNASRTHDLAVRLGGEEFALVLPECELEHAGAIAERIRREISAEPVDLPGGRQCECTASFGVAAALSSDETIHSVLQRADHALYRAKENGRNRVELAGA